MSENWKDATITITTTDYPALSQDPLPRETRFFLRYMMSEGFVESAGDDGGDEEG